MENSWKPGQKSAPAPASAPAPGPAGEKPDAKPGPGPAGKDKPGPARPAAAVEKGPSSPKSEKKASWIQRLADKTENESRGPGRTKKDSETEKKPPLTEAEVEENAKALAAAQIDTMEFLGPAWKDGAYEQDDASLLARGYKALVRRYQLRMPWWLDFVQSQLRYNGPRLRDPKVTRSFMEAIGLRKKETVIDVRAKSSETVDDGTQHPERRSKPAGQI
jgi:hypothetical protein